MVRIISVRYEDKYVISELFNSLDIEKIVSYFLSMDGEFDERRVIFPDLSERVWKSYSLEEFIDDEKNENF